MSKAVPPPFGGDGADPENRVGTGSHRAPTSRKRSSFPWPGAIGAAALVIAGAAVVQNGNHDQSTFTTEPSSLSAQAVVPDLSYRDPNSPDVSRGIDRETLENQAEAQAQQRVKALAELETKSADRAAELLEAQKRQERLEAKKEAAEEAEEGSAAGASSSGQWVLPVAGYTLTARFGETSSLWSTVHTGLDFAAASGTPIVAVSSGTITSAGYDGAYGNKTVMTLDDGTEIWYCHQTSIEVSVGQTVAPGDQIGTVGATGNVTGPHLHLEVHPGGGDAVDPYTALQEHGVTP